MKKRSMSWLLAALLIGCLGTQQAHANNSSTGLGHAASPAPTKSRVTFNKYSLGLFEQISNFKGTVHGIRAKQGQSLTNSTLTNNRPGGKDMVIPLLTIYFSDKDPQGYYLEDQGNGVPNGTTVAFTIPDLTNITNMILLTLGWSFDYTEYGVMTTNGGAVQGYGYVGDVEMNFNGISTITNGIAITVY